MYRTPSRTSGAVLRVGRPVQGHRGEAESHRPPTKVIAVQNTVEMDAAAQSSTRVGRIPR
jgi:hypothetical protein